MNERVREYLELVDIADYEDSLPGALSGGEQQRVALARALAYEPVVLLLDEPLSNLDAKLRKEARIWLKRIQEETGVTTLYVTHDQAEASALSDRIIIMNEGEIEQVGTPEDVFKRPQSHFVADFLGKENFINGSLVEKNGTSGVVSSDANETFQVNQVDTLERGQKVSIAISPEEINISRNGATNGNVIEGTISEKLYYGDKTELIVASDGREIVVVAVDVIPDEEGDHISLELPPDKCAVLSN